MKCAGGTFPKFCYILKWDLWVPHLGDAYLADTASGSVFPWVFSQLFQSRSKTKEKKILKN